MFVVNFENHLTLLKKKLRKYLQSKDEFDLKNTSLAEFLPWIWEQDCSDYQTLIRLIFPPAEEWTSSATDPSKKSSRFSWIQAKRKFDQNRILLRKVFFRPGTPDQEDLSLSGQKITLLRRAKKPLRSRL
jgi:hypothetical protein